MNLKTLRLSIALTFGLLLASLWSVGQTVVGNDAASNYETATWIDGANQGTGFGAWQITNEGSTAGTFVWTSTENGHGDVNTSDLSFGIWSNNTGALTAMRQITEWGNEHSFSIQLAVQWRDGSKGLKLFNDAETEIWDFSITDDGYGGTPWNYYSDIILTFVVTQNGSDINISVIGSSEGSTWTDEWNTAIISETLGGFSVYKNGGTDDGAGERNLYFNNLSISRPTVNATIDPSEITVYGNWDNTDPQLTITWNDATAVTGMSAYDPDAEVWFPLPAEMWEVTNDNGTTATLNIYLDESPAKTFTQKDGEILEGIYPWRVEFDHGEPAPGLTNFMSKTFLVELQITDEFGDPLSSMEMDLVFSPDWDSPNQGYVHDYSNSPIYEVAARGDYYYSIYSPSYTSVLDYIVNVEEDLTIEVVMEGVGPWQVTYEVIGENGWINAYINDYEYFGSGAMIEQGTDVHFEAYPDWAYMVKEWRVNGEVVPDFTNPNYTYTNIEKDIHVSVEFEDYIQPEITPEYQFYGIDQNNDVEFTISWGSETEVTGISYNYEDEFGEPQQTPLVEGTDYSITENTLTIYASFISSLSPEPDNWYGFTAEFGTGWQSWFGVVVLQSISATISPTELSYDLTNPNDLMSTIIWGVSAEAIQSISTALKYDLIEGTDYHVDGSWLYIHNSYLSQNLMAVDDELALNVLFDNGDDVLLTITAIESGVTNATIDPTSTSFYEHEFPEYVDITVTWNDATEILNLSVLVSGEWGSEEMDWPYYDVTDNGDGTANLRVYFDETDKYTKAEEFTYVTVTINYDIGAPSLFLMTIIYEYYEVIVNVDPEYAGWVDGDYDYAPGETVYLEAYPNMDYIFWSWNNAEGNPISLDNPYTFEMPSQNVELTAQFMPIEYFAVDFGVVGGNGTLTAEANGAPITSGEEIIIGSELLFTATPDENYRVKQWVENGFIIDGYTAETIYIGTHNSYIELTVEFEEIPAMYTVTFTVTSGTSPIEGATVNFDGTDYTTNTSGIATITDVEAGTYSYTVSMTGYDDETGSVTVTDADINEPVTLTPVGVGTTSFSQVSAYPNPFGEQITISNANLVKRVVVTNLIGQQVITMDLNGTNEVNTSSLKSGIYLITFEGHNGQRTIRKMIKR